MANIYDKSSLVLIPSGTKTGKIFSQKPVSGDGDFTFTRASAATRVNADGNIEKETGNLLLQSNQFNTTWDTTSTITLTSGQSGYDGSSNAWILARASTGGQRLFQDISKSGVQTISIYAKANLGNWLYIRCNTSGSPAESWYDLSNGVLGTSSGGRIDAEIESVGSDWYRCSMSFNASTTQVRFYPVSGNNTNDGNSESIYIQDAQLEQGLVARDYIETTTAAVYGGITDNTPRLDYTDSSCPALLLEPLRTNRVTQSELFNIDTAWLLSGRPAVESNVIDSPEGLQNGSRLTFGSGNVLRYQPELLFTNGYSYSIFVKKDVGRYVTIYAAFFTTSAIIGFDLDEGTCQAGGVIEPYGDDWYRISVSNSVAGDADKSGYFYLYSTDTLASTSSVSGNKLYVYGAQIEDASYATSYIPTYGSSVSRVDDLFDLRDVQTNGLVTSTQGTMFFHITDIEGTAVVYNIQTLNDLSYALRFVVKDSGFLIYQRVNNVQTQLFNTNSLSLSEWKIAMSWNGTSLITSVNGTSYIDTIDASIASQLDKIARVNPQAVSVTTNQILVFPTQLTEAELNDLTTL